MIGEAQQVEAVRHLVGVRAHPPDAKHIARDDRLKLVHQLNAAAGHDLLDDGELPILLPAGELLSQLLAFNHARSEEHTSELQSLMRISYAVFCLKKKNTIKHNK